MSGFVKDLTGRRFGRLTVLGFAYRSDYSGKSAYYWRCKCDCGNEVDVNREALISGNTKSCGCLRKEASSKRIKSVVEKICKKLEYNGEIHTLSEWARITGIPYATIYKRYANGHKVEEILSKKELKRGGKREKLEENSKQFTAFGETHSIRYWADKYGMTYHMLYSRIVRGIKPEIALTATPKELQMSVEYNGETHTLKDWSEITGISYDTIRGRKARGMPPEKILFKGRLDKPKKRR